MTKWFEVVSPETSITQGDLIFDCPLLVWKTDTLERNKINLGSVNLTDLIGGIRADVIVLTQACDLEQEKVDDVVLCTHISESEYKKSWESAVIAAGQNPTIKAWRRACRDIAAGYIWNHSFINSYHDKDFSMELRVVNFGRVFTVARSVMEIHLALQNQLRLRLAEPYREHLSQAFARFFMRVGLPQPIQENW